MNYASTSNIREVIKFYNLNEKTFETDFNYAKLFASVFCLCANQNEKCCGKFSLPKARMVSIALHVFYHVILKCSTGQHECHFGVRRNNFVGLLLESEAGEQNNLPFIGSV